MRIALLTDGIFPYVVGGMQRHSFYLAKYLLRAGHEVVLFHTNASDKKIELLEVFSEEEKKKLQSIVIPFPDLGSTPGHYIRESYEYSRLIYAKLKKVLPVDFIYAKGFAGWETLNRKSQGDHLPPIGVNFHGYEMFQPAASFLEWIKYKLLLRSPVLFNVRNADVVFSYGGKITPIIRSLGVPANKIAEIPTGIAEEWLNNKPHAPGKPRKIVFVGRWERRKGVPELNKAIASILLKHEGDAEFHFIGDIPASHRLKKSAVIYHGAISDSEALRNKLREMDLLVCPSHSEGMPNVIMEALASGLAVVATDVGAVSVMVNPSNGWLIAPGDVKQLAAALSAAIATPDQQLAAMRASAVATVRNGFLWDVVVARTEQEIQRFTEAG